MTSEELAELVGFVFPGATYTIEPYEHWLMADAVQSPDVTVASSGVAHPMFAYYVALGGMGMTLDELFAVAGATAADGVMFGECRIEILAPLRVGASYQVAGEIVGAERKIGRRVGTFDTLTFRLDVFDPEQRVASTTNTFVFPRGASDEG